MAFLVFGGISTLTTSGPPNSVRMVLHGWPLTVWTVSIIIGPLLSIIGIYWRGRLVTGLGIEQVGLVLLTGGCILYDVALFFVLGKAQGGLFVSSFVTAIAVANIWRSLQIRRRVQFLIAASRPRTRKGGK